MIVPFDDFSFPAFIGNKYRGFTTIKDYRMLPSHRAAACSYLRRDRLNCFLLLCRQWPVFFHDICIL